MISWCAYCQEYMGEIPPFQDLRLSHGMCEKCAGVGLISTKDQIEKLEYLTDFQKRFWNMGRTDDFYGAEVLIKEGLLFGLRPVDMLFGLAGPALVRIGDLWACNELTVAEEHRFTAVCEFFTNEISKCIPFQKNKVLVRPSPRVLLANIPGNEHCLGVRFVSLGFQSNGVHSEVAPETSTAEDLLELALKGDFQVVGLSASMATQHASLLHTLKTFWSEPAFKGRLLLGGGAIKAREIVLDDPRVIVVERPSFEPKEIHHLLGQA